MRALSAPEIIAHRGASHDAPENTAAAFSLAWDQGADACELDVRLTKDGRAVVIHDATTGRTTSENKRVSSQVIESLQMLDAGAWKGARWKGERIPTLGEALETVPDGRRLFIEIKCGAEVLPRIGRALETSGKCARQIAIIGFNFATMRRAREHSPDSAIYWIASPKAWSRGGRPSVDTLIAKAKSARFDGLDLDCRFAIDREFVSRVKSAGLKLFVWTVNDAGTARRMAAAGVDGIATNRPLWLREQLAK